MNESLFRRVLYREYQWRMGSLWLEAIEGARWMREQASTPNLRVWLLSSLEDLHVSGGDGGGGGQTTFVKVT